jgi:hypothetical protein
MGTLVTVHTIAARRQRRIAQNGGIDDDGDAYAHQVEVVVASIDGVLTQLWLGQCRLYVDSWNVDPVPSCTPADVLMLEWVEARYHDLHQLVIGLYPDVCPELVERTRRLKEEASDLSGHLDTISEAPVMAFVAEALRHNRSVVQEMRAWNQGAR